MLQLNILSPKDKQSFGYERARLVSLRFARRFFFLIIFAAGLFLPSYFITVFQERSITAEENRIRADQRIARSVEVERAIEKSNREAGALQGYLSRKPSLGASVELLIIAVSPGLVINTVRADQEKKRIDIEGIAGRRDDLLKTIAALKTLPFVAGVSSPISNIVKESNSPFRLEVAIK